MGFLEIVGVTNHTDFLSAFNHGTFAHVSFKTSSFVLNSCFGAGCLETGFQVFFGGAVEDWGDEVMLNAGFGGQSTCNFAQVSLENLTQVHTAWNAQWVEHKINWSAVWEVWHVFRWQDFCHNAFVTVTVSELVADLQFTTLCHVGSHHFAHAWFEVYAVVAALETHGANNSSALTGRNAQGGVFDLSSFLTED